MVAPQVPLLVSPNSVNNMLVHNYSIPQLRSLLNCKLYDVVLKDFVAISAQGIYAKIQQRKSKIVTSALKFEAFIVSYC